MKRARVPKGADPGISDWGGGGGGSKLWFRKDCGKLLLREVEPHSS